MADEQTFEEAVTAFYPDEESEPLEAPTDEALSDEEPEETEAEEVAEEEAEESAEEGDEQEAESESDDGDILIYEINDKEYTAKDIEKLEVKAKELQAGYTKKYQALAEDAKALESAISKTNDLSSQLEVLVAEDEEVNWSELKEDDPDEYIRLKERADNRKAKLAEVKANSQVNTQSNVDFEAERVKLVEANPHWLEDGKPTQAYKDEMQALDTYYKDNNWSQEQMQRVAENASLIQLVLEDVKRKSESKVTEQKKAKAKKKIIATPKKSGMKKASTDNISVEDIFYPKN